MLTKVGEHMTKDGAHKLAAQIKGYWAKRGHSVAVFVQRVEGLPDSRDALYEIRSDMIDGLPSLRAPVQIAA